MRTRLLTVNPSSECYQNNGTKKQNGSAFSRLFFFALTHCDLSAQSPRPRTRGTLETTRFQKSLRAARLLLFAQISAGKPQICDFSFCLRVHRKSLKKVEDKLSRQIIFYRFFAKHWCTEQGWICTLLLSASARRSWPILAVHWNHSAVWTFVQSFHRGIWWSRGILLLRLWLTGWLGRILRRGQRNSNAPRKISISYCKLTVLEENKRKNYD